MTLTLLALSVLPVLLLLFIIYRQDKYEKEPLGLLLKVFFVGCFCALPAIVMELGLNLVPVGNAFTQCLYNGFCVAGFSEELCKLLLLTAVVWHNSNFNEYFDGIVYAVFLSLGFACVENVMYVFGEESIAESLSVGAVRALLSVPAHFLFAVIMGYHFSLAKFDPSRRRSHYAKALLYPLLLHGTFDALLLLVDLLGTDNSRGVADPYFSSLLFTAFIVFDIAMWRWGIRRIKQLQKRSQEQDFDRQDPFKNFQWE